MTIKSKLEEAARCLDQANKEAVAAHELDLGNAISMPRGNCRAALAIALADPRNAWIREAEDAWETFVAADHPSVRFAAGIAAGELKFWCKANQECRDVHIADLEAIAKGGGE